MTPLSFGKRFGGDQRGSIILEGLIAILVFSFGILGLVGLQATTMKNTSQAKMRIDASLVANQQLASMWLDRNNLASYAEASPGVTVPGLPKGKRITVVTGDQVSITVTWEMPGGAASTFSTVAKINGN